MVHHKDLVVTVGMMSQCLSPAGVIAGFCLYFLWESQKFTSLSETTNFEPQENASWIRIFARRDKCIIKYTWAMVLLISGCMLVVKVHFFACSCPDLTTPFVEEAIFTPFYASAHFVKYWLQRLGFISGLSIMFQWSMCVFLMLVPDCFDYSGLVG